MPATVGFPGDETMLHDYLDGILDTVLLKDVAERLGVSNIGALGALTRYMFGNIGNLIMPQDHRQHHDLAGNQDHGTDSV